MIKFIGCMIGLMISDFILIKIQNKLCKKVNYDCSKCKVWDCPNHYCSKFRDKK